MAQRMLADRYELGPLIGAGGMADVYRGQDSLLGRTVAIKMLRADLARDDTFQVRFRREAQAAASLSFPNIVAVFDTGVDTSAGLPAPFIVMEYIDGSTLRDVLRAEGPLVPQRALAITAEVCAGLQYSHEKGIVHRDIKPGNVMLTSQGSVKVMDFGIARAVTSSTASMTQTSTVLGTAHYLSPEQARGETVDARSDLYSTGCLVYELLTGRPPFTGESPVAIAYQHVREIPMPPSALRPDISPQVDAVVMKALAKNADNRYQSGAEMRRDLMSAASGTAVMATPIMSDQERTQVLGPQSAAASQYYDTGLPEEPGPKRRTSSIILMVLGVLALVTVGGALLFGSLGRTGDIEVPDLTGMTMNQASDVLDAVGLRLGDVQSVESEPEFEDKVVDQDPKPRAKIDSSDAVNVSIGAGAKTVQVPKVVGMSLADAKAALSEAGLQTGTVSEVASNKPSGEVIASEPAESSEVPSDSTVNLDVSSGEVKVPNVVGMTEGEATSTLEDAEFRVSSSTRTSSKPAGTVIDQGPVGGQTAQPGSVVSIVVSEGEAPPPPPTPTPSPSPTVTGPAAETTAPGPGPPAMIAPDLIPAPPQQPASPEPSEPPLDDGGEPDL